MTLILSIAALLLGPPIYAAGRKNKIARKLLDGLIILSIAVIIFVHIVPQALAQGGAIAIVVIILGVAFPMLLERLFRKAADTAGWTMSFLSAANPCPVTPLSVLLMMIVLLMCIFRIVCRH